MSDKISQAVYNRAVKTAKSAVNRAGLAGWIIGDAALTVQTEYAKDRMSEFADAIGVEVSTVRNFRTMAKKYPADAVVKTADGDKPLRELQLVTIYGIFTSQDDAVELVTNGNAGAPWKVTDARELVKSRKNAGSDDAGSDDAGEVIETTESKRAALQAEVDRLAGQLQTAQAALDKFNAANPVVTVHSPAGLPQHTVNEPHAACPDCKEAGIAPVVPIDGPRKPAARRNRKNAA